jgi:hypothetical protein
MKTLILCLMIASQFVNSGFASEKKSYERLIIDQPVDLSQVKCIELEHTSFSRAVPGQGLGIHAEIYTGLLFHLKDGQSVSAGATFEAEEESALTWCNRLHIGGFCFAPIADSANEKRAKEKLNDLNEKVESYLKSHSCDQSSNNPDDAGYEFKIEFLGN